MLISRSILRSSSYSAIDLSDERFTVLVTPLVVLQPLKLVNRQGVQPCTYLPDALLVVASDRQAATGGSGRLYNPRRLLGSRPLSTRNCPLGASRRLLNDRFS